MGKRYLVLNGCIVAGSSPVLTNKKLKTMRSKTFQRIIDKMEKDSWWIKMKRYIIVELYTIKCLGIIKYLKNKI